MVLARQLLALFALWAVLALLSAQAARAQAEDDVEDEIDEEEERLLSRAGRYEEWRRKQEAGGTAVPPLHGQDDTSHIHPPLDPAKEPRTTTTRRDVCIENPLGEEC